MFGWWLLIVGCGGRPPCDACDDGALCVAVIDEADGAVEHACASVPSACDGALSCRDNPCVLAAYGLCPAGSVGGLCDDTPAADPALTCYVEP